MTNVTPQTDNRAKEQARMQFEAIAAMVERLNHAKSCEDNGCTTHAELHFYPTREATAQEIQEAREEYHDVEKAREAIEEDPLTVEVRSAWHWPSADDHDKRPAEYTILLCWGGPAVRIIGELDEQGEPDSARLEFQDWFTPWEDYPLTLAEEQTLIEYARVFSYGE